MFPDDLILGAGGREPGLWVLAGASGQLRELAMFAPGESVYALCLHSDGSMVAAGTRVGTIHVASLGEGEMSSLGRAAVTLFQGAPVLAVCFAGPTRLIAADTKGRCLLWRNFANQDPPVLLSWGQESVCSLLMMPEGRVAALSADGGLVVLDADRLTVTHSTSGPKPSMDAGMPGLQYWSPHNAIVYPAGGGQLAAWRLNDPDVRMWTAHHSVVSAIAIDGDMLHTFGKSDCLMKIWADLESSACAECRCPTGIIGARMMPEVRGSMVLIDQRGRAGRYLIGDDGSCRSVRLGDQIFRSMAGPSSSDIEAMARQRRLAAATELQAHIQAQIDANRPDGLETAHSQMQELGFGLESLELRIQQAVREQDLLTELRLRQSLVQQMPDGDARSSVWAAAYAVVLKRLWRPREAYAAYANAMGYEDDLSRLRQVIQIMTDDMWIARTTLPLSALIEAANVVGASFDGRWVVDCSVPILFAEPGLTARHLADKYHQVKAEAGLSDLPDAEQTRCWWLSEGTLEQTDAVLFKMPPEPQGHLRPGILVRNAECQSSLLPLVLFEVPTPNIKTSVQDHNHRVLCSYQWLSQGDLAARWPGRVRQTVISSIRRLRNMANGRALAQEACQ